MNEYILSLDQGTTSSRAILFDTNSNIIAIDQKELTQIYPKQGWVEHDPVEILNTQLETIKGVLEKSGVTVKKIKAIGVTNQRETTVLWDKNTGIPVYNAIVWQCKRTSDMCEEIKKSSLNSYIEENTGLVVDSYFSATKIKWILDNIPDAREKAHNGQLIFGTIDTWLIWNLTNKKVHATDYSNASRTMLYNIKNLCWDETILTALDIPSNILPEVKQSSGVFGYTDHKVFDDVIIPISGVAGDQQAALFGQACFKEGTVKNTYGTGCFILMNTGNKLIKSQNKLVTTIAWAIDNEVEYALEGSVFIAGAVIQWLRDELGIISRAEESEICASSVADSNGIYIVPAFVGLGAPYWNMHCRGSIHGLTRGSNRNHIVRAALESIAFQTKDVLNAMEKDAKMKVRTLKVDGGAANNNFLMQFQSDILDVDVERPKILESTALGAAYLAGLGIGIWKNKNEIKSNRKVEKIFKSTMAADERNKLFAGWQEAVRKTIGE
ncbi:MAG: glycerol kinase GlpK [Clostridiales bacterium]|nr:glycerol kinase GlpK [Clostridiales bacterium]